MLKKYNQIPAFTCSTCGLSSTGKLRPCPLDPTKMLENSSCQTLSPINEQAVSAPFLWWVPSAFHVSLVAHCSTWLRLLHLDSQTVCLVGHLTSWLLGSLIWFFFLLSEPGTCLLTDLPWSSLLLLLSTLPFLFSLNSQSWSLSLSILYHEN